MVSELGKLSSFHSETYSSEFSKTPTQNASFFSLRLVVSNARKAHGQQRCQEEDQRQDDLTTPSLEYQSCLEPMFSFSLGILWWESYITWYDAASPSKELDLYPTYRVLT